MLIPKDATIFFPPHTLHATYDDPDTYNPDRFINHTKLAMDYAGSADYEKRDHYGYGSGRRICVGIHLAERTQWRMTATMLWAFKIEPAIDEKTGKPIEVDLKAYTHGFLAQPLPFKARFTVRSEKHAETIRKSYKSVEAFLKKWEYFPRLQRIQKDVFLGAGESLRCLSFFFKFFIGTLYCMSTK
jgi:hypothetical protein